MPNPLLLTRDPRLVFLAGIVGVPWQDLATDATLNDPRSLELKQPSALNWSWLVPSCKVTADTATLPRPLAMCEQWDLTDQPDDPLLVESTAPRAGTNPATGDRAGSAERGFARQPDQRTRVDHPRQRPPVRLRLQARRRPRTAARRPAPAATATTSTRATRPTTRCVRTSGSYSKVQRYAKAYPGLRQLEVLHDIGDQAVVASICPKSGSGDTTSSAYGYNAAMAALVRQIAPVLVK